MSDVKFSVDPIGAGVGLGTMVYNEMSQRDAERRAQKYYKDNTMMQYRLARQSERESPMNQKIGLRDAGLNPALASEGKFSAPAVASPPAMPDTKGQHLDPLSMSELMNQSLNRELVKEEIRGKNIENTRMEDEDATIDKNVRHALDAVLQNPNLSDEDRKWFESMRDNSHSYSLGSAKGLDRFLDLDVKTQTSKLAKHDVKFKDDLLKLKRDNGSLEALASLDLAQLESLVSNSARARMEIMAIAAGIPKTEQEIRTLESQATKNIAEANSIYHGDVAELWKNKDFESIVARYVDMAISEGLSLVSPGGKVKKVVKASKKFSKH